MEASLVYHTKPENKKNDNKGEKLKQKSDTLRRNGKHY